ncbi:MAG TPA: DegT/DnrJ/EryC1/StrS family aminotransferase [Vicinamibacterales bacterium]|nr:DegT/DnrJ/EryC1/StrS family aminotransferase [Vicinamibacterales bacterium]
MIPYADLRRQYRAIKPEIDEAVLRVLDSTQFILGEEVAAFEREFAAYCGTADAIGVNSGTSALHLALLAADIGPGDEVITVPFTFVATAAAIVYTGATPVFVDIDPETFTMAPAAIEQVITARTKAILPVHLYGHAADMDPILDIARRRGLVVIEDAAQAHGAAYKGRPCGSMGAMAAFSFYPGKNLGAYGEGGAVVTSDPALAKKIRVMRSWGEERRYEHSVKGFNYRMDGIQGAILRVKLRHLEAWTGARRARAAEYARAFAGSGIATPVERPDCRHVYHVYAVRLSQRDSARAALQAAGIQTGVHYPIPIHLQPAHADLGYGRGDFPVSEQAASQVLSLPMFPEMTVEQVEQVAAAVLAAERVPARG